MASDPESLYAGWSVILGNSVTKRNTDSRVVIDMKEVEGNERCESKDKLIYNSKRKYKTSARQQVIK